MSKERPILFNGAMVRAILSGAKTQTRRVVKMPPGFDFIGGSGDDLNDPANWGAEDEDAHWWALAAGPDTDHVLACPFGQPGDRLWVRETWADANSDCGPCILYRADDGRRYLADESYPVDYDRYPGALFSQWAADVETGAEGRYRPSIHMPRWACRLMLEITAVRVERLQAISEEDAQAEGANPITAKVPTHRDAFRYIWGDTGGDWDSNPWVWVIEFKRIEA